MQLHSILDGANYLAVHVPWAAVIASPLVSGLIVAIKKWFSVQSERVMISLVALVAMIVAGGNYLLHVPTHDPSIIAVQAAVLAFMTQPAYFFIVKPLAASIEQQLQKAAAFDAQVKSASQPVAPVPDFSS